MDDTPRTLNGIEVPIVFLVEGKLPDGTELRACTGVEDIGNGGHLYPAVPMDLAVVNVEGSRVGLVIRTPFWTRAPVTVQVRVGVVLVGEDVSEAAWMYEGTATLAGLYDGVTVLDTALRT